MVQYAMGGDLMR